MKVLMLSTSFPVNQDSISGIFILRLIESFGSDIEITVLTPSFSNYTESRSISNYSINFFRYAPRAWEKIAHQPGGIPVAIKNNPFLLFLLPVFFFSMFISSLRLARNADLIHANWSVNGVVAGLTGLLVNVPVVTTLRGADVQRASGTFIDRCFLKFCLTLNKNLIAVSRAISEIVKRLCPCSAEKLLVISNGVGHAFLEKGLKRSYTTTSKLRLVTIGSLIPRKGIDIIIRAISEINNDVDIELSIIGDGLQKNILKKIILNLGLETTIQLSGNIPHTEIPLCLFESDVLILSSYSEGRPNVVLEAMATGLPVIASDIDGVRELIRDGENGLLFEAGNIKQLSDRIKQLDQDRELHKKIGMAARDFILEHKLLWNQTASKYKKLYQNVLNQQKFEL